MGHRDVVADDLLLDDGSLIDIDLTYGSSAPT
jgi:hypothetical protein